MRTKTLMHAPRTVLGYRKNGTPIFPIAGASESPPEPPPGTTIAVPIETPVPTPADLQPNTNGAPAARMYTQEELESARQQEKDKLYQRLNKQDETLKSLQDEQKKRLDAEAKARKDAEEAAEKARQENLTFEQKLAEAQTDWETKFVGMQGEIAKRDALLEAERRFQEISSFRARRVEEESEHIMPELRDLVSGANEDEIEASLSLVKEKTAAIVAQVTQQQQNQALAQQQARQQVRGVGTTAPPVGPMENQSEQETFTAEEIRDMDMATYMKNRTRLLGAASQQMCGRGM